jgi:hypothetical protein
VALTLVALVALALVFAVPFWALRKHDKMFPNGWDRTGWNPVRGHGSWFRTKFTWLSGGRG